MQPGILADREHSRLMDYQQDRRRDKPAQFECQSAFKSTVSACGVNELATLVKTTAALWPLACAGRITEIWMEVANNAFEHFTSRHHPGQVNRLPTKLLHL